MTSRTPTSTGPATSVGGPKATAKVVRGLLGFTVVAALAPIPTGSVPAAYASTPIAYETRPTAVNAHRGRLVWSAYDNSLRAFRLMTRANGIVSAVPVRPRRRAFDVDLGPDRSGQTVAVYSRCRREPIFAYTRNNLPTHVTGRGCDVYRYAFASGREAKIRAVSSPAASEVLPSIWHGRIAYARVFERRRGLAGHLPHLYVASLRSSAARREREVRGGTRGLYQRGSGGRSPEFAYEGGPGPVAIELRGRRLAFVWNLQRGDVCPNRPNEVDPEPADESQIWLASVGGPSRLIERGCTGDPISYLFAPSFSGDYAYYYQRRNQRENEAHVRRLDLRTLELADAHVPAPLIALSVDKGIPFLSRGTRDGIVEIAEGDPLNFEPSSPFR